VTNLIYVVIDCLLKPFKDNAPSQRLVFKSFSLIIDSQTPSIYATHISIYKKMFIFALFPFRVFALLMRIAFTPVVPHGRGGGSPRRTSLTNMTIREAVEVWCRDEAKAREVYGPMFNQPLDWDTSSVTDMSSMFAYAQLFNQPLAFDMYPHVADILEIQKSIFSDGVPPLMVERPQVAIKFPFSSKRKLYMFHTEHEFELVKSKKLEELDGLDVFKNLFPCLRDGYKPAHSNVPSEIALSTTPIVKLILSHCFVYNELVEHIGADTLNSDNSD